MSEFNERSTEMSNAAVVRSKLRASVLRAAKASRTSARVWAECRTSGELSKTLIEFTENSLGFGLSGL
jgi:hypothetical protein